MFIFKWIAKVIKKIKETNKLYAYSNAQSFDDLDNYSTDEDAPYFTDGQ